MLKIFVLTSRGLGVSEQVACGILKEVKGSGKSPGRLDWRSPSLPAPVYQVLKAGHHALAKGLLGGQGHAALEHVVEEPLQPLRRSGEQRRLSSEAFFAS